MTFIGIAGIISWIGWTIVLFKFAPDESTEIALGLFYLSLFVALASTFTVIGFYFRVWLNKNEVFANYISVALRQGILLSVITIGCLTFELLHVLNWWSGLLLVAVVTMVEFYFTAKNDG